ncbi:Polysaccharide deacetylase [Microlunatus sagamiharensis]|uniref:Polysaccharide deacetylase n=1 Tax=Microlunatus sagamiharensis TaxID=546874 RepID=A0A1H2LUK6_9ACTN|nr:polysaccharide deacetylase family protein [Microlunatus sagamiharensis]SDU84271.1 Polysaccharide deacetylase [Microlunatus sagamiharensis]
MINLCFHGVGAPARPLETDEAGYWIEEGLFAEVLDEVRDRRDVSISFDDGNASDVEIALPALRRRGLRATFFALAGRLDEPGSLGREDLRLLRREGMAVGSHGMDHVPWRGLGPERQEREWVTARTVIEEAARHPVVEAALPLGRYDRRTLAGLRRLGYARVHSSDRRPALPGSWLVPRYSVTASDDLASVRAQILTGPAPRRRALLELKGFAKRVR